MPASMQLFPEQNYLIVTYSGKLSTEDVLQVRKMGIEDPTFSPSMNVIDDVSAVESTNIQFDQMEQLSSKSVSKTGVKRAFVVRTDFQRGMANMYRVLSESYGQHFKIFEKMDEAKNWVLKGDDQ